MKIKWFYSLRLIIYFIEVENIENLKFIIHSCTDEVPPGEWEWKKKTSSWNNEIRKGKEKNNESNDDKYDRSLTA